MKLTFVGGAGSVTGACYLLESEKSRILIDCGLQQGASECEKENFKPFPFDSKTIEAVFITHAHIDHIGRVPKLIKEGFVGTIYSTAPTKDAARDLLEDAQHLMMHDLKQGQEPLYKEADIDKALDLWEGIAYHKIIEHKDLHIELYNSGHILGSASVFVKDNKTSVVFSGDLGNVPAPLVKDTEYITNANYALVESAYGGRVHESLEERSPILEDLIEDTVRTKGTLLIPAFAMERTQQLLFELNELVIHGRIPKIPIFIDSPLAIRLTEVFKKYENDPMFFDQEFINAVKKGARVFDFPGLRFTLTTEESKEINNISPPKIIIAGSGMSTGGRILHHEIRYLPDPNSTIFFVGYQTKGSLGRRILEGADEVKIMGEKVVVRARVKAIGGFSAHADQPLLVKWVEAMKKNVKKVFVVQGEEEESQALVTKIKDELAIDARVPESGETVELV